MGAILIVPMVVILVLSAWGFRRVRRARHEIRLALAGENRDVLRIERRYVRLGPFAGTTSRSQLVYRIETQGADGHRRVVWARWGRAWLTWPDALELKWDA